MGSYNTAVLTTAGQALLASAIAGGDAVTFSKFQTSSYQYASTTDLAALTYLNDVEQEVAPSGGGVTGDTTIYSSATVTSENVALEYENYTVGLFASDGENEVLFAVSTAITPDVIPADDGTTPSTYTYTMSIGVSTTEDLVIEVSPTVYLTKGSVIDSLTSPTTDQPLSANQGRVLKQMIDDGAKALKVDYVGAETTKAYPENEVIYYSNKFYKVIKEGGLPANYTIVPATDLDDAGLDPETIVTINGIPANGIINASDITFDNTGTGMAATNVQGAVTELNSKFNIQYLGSTTIDSSMNLPNDYTILYCEILTGPTNQGRFSCTILKQMLDYGSQSRQQFQYEIIDGQVRVTTDKNANTITVESPDNRLPNAVLHVWYV